MNGLIAEQVGVVRARHPDLAVEARPDGTVLVTVHAIPLPPGWNKPTSAVHFLLPVGYPVSRPDCFWADADLRLSNGSLPCNANIQVIPSNGVQALWFSWHLAAWNPSKDDVGSYLRAIRGRFLQVR